MLLVKYRSTYSIALSPTYKYTHNIYKGEN